MLQIAAGNRFYWPQCPESVLADTPIASRYLDDFHAGRHGPVYDGMRHDDGMM